MNTLVIHPTDASTDFLKEVYRGKDWTIINANVSKSVLKLNIKSHDRIFLLGHGCEDGMFGFGHFIIDSSYVQMLREKICICIWCNADVFVEKYKLNSPLYSGMFVSEVDEAYLFSLSVSDDLVGDIDNSNNLFCELVNKFVDDDLNMILESYKSENNKIINFNNKRIFIN